MPLGSAGAMMVYRESMLKAAGINAFPKDTAGFLAMFKALKEKGTPGGMALGNATGDCGWTHWLMWAFGGKIVDKDNKVVIDSPETLKALEYSKELYRQLHSRHAVVARSEQQQGVPRRPDQRHEQRHLDLLRREELDGSEGQGDWRPTSTTRRSRSARSACRPSITCSSTR